MTDKTTDLAGAARLVKDGDTVVMGGCLYSRPPYAFMYELLRQGHRDLTLARNLMCFEAELGLVRGTASHLMASWVGIGLPWGIPKVFRQFVERDPSIYEEWSHLSFGLRFLAGSMGMPFLPTASMLGSDLLKTNGAEEVRSPFTGELLVAVPGCQPEVAVIHAHRVDPEGNAQVNGPVYMDLEFARAAETVIVTAEQLVSTDEVTRTADRTVVPGFLVDAVVAVPFGAYPGECYGRYEADFAHFEQYVALVDEGGAAGVEEYLRKFVDEPESFAGMLEAVGSTRLLEQQRRAQELVAA